MAPRSAEGSPGQASSYEVAAGSNSFSAGGSEAESMKLIFAEWGDSRAGARPNEWRALSYTMLNELKKVQKIEIRGNAYLRSMQEGRAAEVHSADMDFFLDKDQRLERAVAMRDAGGKTLDADSDLQLTGASLIEVLFQAQGERSLLKQMRTEGRSVINLSAPKSKVNDPRATNKRLTADAVKLIWRITGRDLDKAEAVGNAELFVDPVVKNARADKHT